MSRDTLEQTFDVVIVGGCGHVGLPLGLSLANKGLRVCLCDVDGKRATLVKKGVMPFIEYDADPILKKVLKNGMIHVSTDLQLVSQAHYVIIAVGTPVDAYLNPETRAFLQVIADLKQYLREDQTLIVRSSVYPHTCEQMLNVLGRDKKWRIAYCPERIVQGYAMRELVQLPQIVAGLTPEAFKDSAKLFSILSPKIIKTSVGEAELVKLFTNAWRYIQFAITNQFYMIAQNFGIDYDRVRQAMVDGYDRTATLPTAGFAAGPCLLKDTMQLSAFCGNEFILGHAAMMINEGLPNFIVKEISKRCDLSKAKVGILGMAFKADIDDIRDSLSFKLGKILRFKGSKVYYSDEYAENPDFVSKEELLRCCDAVIVGVPHSAYKGLVIPSHMEVIDLWGVTKRKDVEIPVEHMMGITSKPSQA